MPYKKRSVKSSIEFLLQHFPAVVILGARQVGKSTLTQQVLPNATLFDLERDSDFAIVELDPFDWHEIHSAPASGELLEALIKPERLLELPAHFDKQQLLSLCLYGGYPEPVLNEPDNSSLDTPASVNGCFQIAHSDQHDAPSLRISELCV